ncbi:MAG: sigma-70 family RNA polymerase sigma factor [Planctomyces sp.]|nr:sigma-70 family RNA polymerase sigma factor [Planctomyces sp.]
MLNKSNTIIAQSTSVEIERAEQIVQSRRFLLSIAERLMSDALRSQLTASDVVQQTLLAAIRDQESFRGSSNEELTQWLVKILKHRIIDEARRQDTRRRVVSQKFNAALPVQSLTSQPTLLSELVAQETLEQLLKAIEQLEMQQQTIVRLRYIESLSFEKIGERLGLSHDAVRRLWLKAMQSLGQRIGVESEK